ncbi:MAG: potassium transporter TrkG [Bacteroidia bacterium]
MSKNFDRLFKLGFAFNLIGMMSLLIDFGFSHSVNSHIWISLVYFVALLFGVANTIIRYFLRKKSFRPKVLFFDALSFLLAVWAIYYFFTCPNFDDYHSFGLVKLSLTISFIREFSERKLVLKRKVLNPAQFFILSFLTIIFLGMLGLMLPNSSHDGIGIIDALFTSTSAVCVTGLIVVDTATYFTPFGQGLILILIQIGGIGILTFATYFSYFFKGEVTYENQITMGDMTSTGKLGEVFSTLKNILIITFLIETISAISIFSTLNSGSFQSLYDRVFFSVFHAVSAFCNAGFSTLSNGLYEEGFQFNYGLQLIIIFTLVLGGLGFPIVVNLVNFFKYSLIRTFTFNQKRKKYQPWVLNINSRITLITTLVLIVFGFVVFFLLEYNTTLKPHNNFGKIVTALFEATTPRTAGFNTIDMLQLSFPAILVTIILMWIGASPASTGGGIKTSTIAVAVLNIFSLAKGKNRIEVYRREISNLSVGRAFAVITLSLFTIGCGIVIISISDKDLDVLKITFECFSAYSTVGLSLGLTSQLSATAKVVIIFLMFIGRVSVLSVLAAIFRREKYKNYRYPSEEVTIN